MRKVVCNKRAYILNINEKRPESYVLISCPLLNTCASMYGIVDMMLLILREYIIHIATKWCILILRREKERGFLINYIICICTTMMGNVFILLSCFELIQREVIFASIKQDISSQNSKLLYGLWSNHRQSKKKRKKEPISPIQEYASNRIIIIIIKICFFTNKNPHQTYAAWLKTPFLFF